MESCYLCGGKSFVKKPGRVRDNEKLDILECQTCGLVLLSSFAHIGEYFYENSQMHDKESNIEDWIGETAADDERRFLTLYSLIRNKTILDFGCGNGGFLSRVQKIASLAVGVEPERRLQPYFKKKQLHVFSDINDLSQCFDVITLFHVLEHVPDPKNILSQLADKLSITGSIIIEVPNADDALLTLYESAAFEDFTYWSCHLFSFNVNTLSLLAKQAGLKINYIKQIQRYPLSNHLYWLSKKRPGGHVVWSHLNSKELDDAYEKQLGLMGCCDTLIASFRIEHE